MAKKRNKTLIITASFLTLIALVICVSPAMKLKEGTLSWAVLSSAYSFLDKYLGYFTEGLQSYSLVPLALIFVTLLVDFIKVNPVLICILHPLCFASVLIVSRTIQGGFVDLPTWAFTVSLILFALFVPAIAFEKVRRFVKLKEKYEQSAEYVKKDNFVERLVTGVISKKQEAEVAETEEERMARIKAMDVAHARHLLTSTVVPEYSAFPMVPIHDETATLGGSVDTSIYNTIKLEAEIIKANRKAVEKATAEDNIFEPKTLQKKILEDKMSQDVEPLTQLDDQFRTPVQPKRPEPKTESMPSEKVAPVSAPKPQVVAKTVDYSAKPTIVDEGSPEEDADEARLRYEQMLEKSQYGEEDIDYISGVAGLSSGNEGRKSYLINADKYRYVFPSSSLLKHYPVSAKTYSDLDHDPDGITIVETLRQFRVETTLMAIQHGPTFTLYELQLAPGIKVSSVQNFADNIAMNLAVSGVRILAPIPGKIAIGIEVPNRHRDTIGFDIMYPSINAKPLKIPFVLGKTITGDSIVIDLAGTPHLLIAGTTGSGKSVCVNSLICSVLYSKTPAEVRMILVDPKMVELSGYNGIPHLLTPVITQPKRVIKAMAFIISEMERRMQIFKSCGAKKIEDYNRKIEEKSICAVKLPYIMVIVDEFADLMMVVGKELEAYIQRITQIARFTGIHLVLATQRPSVDVITGIIKSNIPSRIAFAVSDVTNSKIIIDRGGAEKLLGRGDMLYLGSTSPDPMRIQGAYIDPEIESIVAQVKKNGEPDYIDESYFEDEEEEDDEDSDSSSSSGGEDMFTKAWKIVSDRGEASASYLQRRLNIGYNRAATLIEKLEDAGYIGPARGSKPREIMRKYIPQEFDD